MSIVNRIDASAAPEAHEDCRRVLELLDSLGDGDPGPGVAEAIAHHFDGCARCLGAEASVERLLAAYREDGRVSLPAGLEQRILDCMCDE
jgi:hypothetical protein